MSLVVLATQAEMDLVLASSQNTTQGEVATSAIEDVLKSSAINKLEFNTANARIIAMKQGLKY